MPMDLTELGMETLVKPLQSEKAKSPIEVTELGMETLVKPLQPEKAELLMEVKELGITKSFTSSPFKYRCRA